MNIFVGSLPFSIDSTELNKLFAQHGSVTSAKVINDRDTGKSRGFGFVEMPNKIEANLAIDHLHRREVQGSILKVSEVKPGK